MNSMTLLRLFALTSNFAFIAYACLGELFPILALHVALLPLNAWRLIQSMRGDRPTPIGPGAQGFYPPLPERTSTAGPS
jgi:CRP/FNR family transcriptional regulator, cyclic AMP receptor protein